MLHLQLQFLAAHRVVGPTLLNVFSPKSLQNRSEILKNVIKQDEVHMYVRISK